MLCILTSHTLYLVYLIILWLFHVGVSCTVVDLTCLVTCGCVLCVGVLVISVIVYIVFYIVCTAFLYCFVHVYLFLFVLSVLEQGLLPPSDNSIAPIIIIITIRHFHPRHVTTHELHHSDSKRTRWWNGHSWRHSREGGEYPYSSASQTLRLTRIPQKSNFETRHNTVSVSQNSAGNERY